MKVYVYSKHRFDAAMKQYNITDETVETKKDICLISINGSDCTDENYPELHPWFKRDHANVLNLIFEDLEEPESDEKRKIYEAEGYVLFNEAHARRILEFIERNKEKYTCIVHCAAGIARSGAVGEFINDYFGGSYEAFKTQNPHTLPNPLVLRTLKRVAREVAGK